MIPRSALIPSVPFVGWGEAPDLEFVGGVNTNPSQPACLLMLMNYWANESERPRESRLSLDPPDDWDSWNSESGDAESIDDLKKPLANGYPVHVSAGATPVGHYWGAPFLYTSGPFAEEKLGPRSDLLGVIVPYEMFQSTETSRRLLREVVTLTDRIVIGYDDDRQILILHDPSFGPAWQVPYEDFDRMWQPYDRHYAFTYPPDAITRLENRPKTSTYRKRSTNELAAFYYVFGYALGCVGFRSEADEYFRRGLELPKLSRGYRHLFYVELAVQAMAHEEASSAIELLYEAADLVPNHLLVWRMISHLYQADPSLQPSLLSYWRTWLARRPGAYRKLLKALPQDFLLFPNGMTYVPITPPSAGDTSSDSEAQAPHG